MSLNLGLLATFAPLFILLFSSLGSLQKKKLWWLSFSIHSLSVLFFLLLTTRFYFNDPSPSTDQSFLFFQGNMWSEGTFFSWDYESCLLALSSSLLVTCLHFLSRKVFEESRSIVGAIAAYQFSILGALGSASLFLFAFFFVAAILPRIVLIGLNSDETRVEAAKETGFFSYLSFLCLLICFLVFSDHYRGLAQDWFRVVGGQYEIRPGTMGFFLLFLSSIIGSGIFPFHGTLRKVFALESSDLVIPIMIQPVLGITLLFRFATKMFPAELQEFSPWLLIIYACATIYSSIGFAGAQSGRKRIFWLQQLVLSFVLVGFFSLNNKGWHGSLTLLFYQALSVPLAMMMLVCHERRGYNFSPQKMQAYPLFGLATIGSSLFVLCAPISMGFYGLLLILWSLSADHSKILPVAVLSLPILVWAGMKIMFFNLGSRDPKESNEENMFTDLNRFELISILPLSLLLFAFGIFPRVVMSPIGNGAKILLQLLGAAK